MLRLVNAVMVYALVYRVRRVPTAIIRILKMLRFSSISITLNIISIVIVSSGYICCVGAESVRWQTVGYITYISVYVV